MDRKGAWPPSPTAQKVLCRQQSSFRLSPDHPRIQVAMNSSPGCPNLSNQLIFKVHSVTNHSYIGLDVGLQYSLLAPGSFFVIQQIFLL